MKIVLLMEMEILVSYQINIPFIFLTLRYIERTAILWDLHFKPVHINSALIYSNSIMYTK